MDKTYDHTIYFQNESAQRSYFQSLTPIILENYSYTRAYGRGYLSVAGPADDFYNVNYMMFRNTSYGNKWFYAFVDAPEYVNDKTTKLHFTLDPLQSWYFDYTPQTCYIEREHTDTDGIGENIIEESLPVGEYQYNMLDNTDWMQDKDDLAILVFTTESSEAWFLSTFTGGYPPGRVISGVYSGCGCIPFDQNEIGTGHGWDPDREGGVFAQQGDINLFLEKLTEDNKADGVYGMVMFPKNFLVNYHLVSPSHVVDKIIQVHIDFPLTLGSYRPRNKKLLTAPYNELYVTNNNGKAVNYNIAFFDADFPGPGGWWDPILVPTVRVYFDLTAFIAPNPEVGLVPRLYKGVDKNNNERLIVDNFPRCSWNIDSFKAWIAQRKYTFAASLLGQTASGATEGAVESGGALGAGVGAAKGLIGGILSNIGQIAQASTLPDQMRGQQTDGLNVVENCLGFTWYQAYVHPQYAAILDDYFDRFGYACKRNKTPSVSNRRLSRPHWGYVKTIGCTITGSIPQDDMVKICDIYNKGITFWRTGAEVGNYSLNNTPVTGGGG